jgi:hypothetical protein
MRWNVEIYNTMTNTLIALLAILICQHSTISQITGPANALERAVVSEEQRSLTTTEAFNVSLRRVQAPGGMVTIVGCHETTLKKDWKAQGQPLAQILNNLVAADRNYRWEVQDGAIDLLPTSGEPMLLQTYISAFNINTNSSLEALAQLMKKPEVKDAMTNLRLVQGLTILTYPFSPTEFSLRFKGGTFRQALNAIAVAKGTDIWEYRETHCAERNEVTIRF